MKHRETSSRVAVLGAPGYTGMELVRLLSHHPHTEIVFLTGDSRLEKPFEKIFPGLISLRSKLPALIQSEQVDWQSLDVVFCALPHGVSQKVIKEIPGHVRIVDLGADFRLSDTKIYRRWYGEEHVCPELLDDAVYGLTEHYSSAITEGRLIACPGCYPTATLLGLLPLLSEGLIEHDDIIVDAKSGVSGAGRGLKEETAFCSVSEGIAPYALGGHRHQPEMEEQMKLVSGGDVVVNFVPHLLPLNRGEMVSAYVRRTKSFKELYACLEERYRHSSFVWVASGEEGVPSYGIPDTRCVRGTNFCYLWLIPLRGNRVLVLSFLDNLLKGSAGQAIQNYNLMCGYEETEGLPSSVAMFP